MTVKQAVTTVLCALRISCVESNRNRTGRRTEGQKHYDELLIESTSCTLL